jgi:hypothetical protein
MYNLLVSITFLFSHNERWRMTYDLVLLATVYQSHFCLDPCIHFLFHCVSHLPVFFLFSRQF